MLDAARRPSWYGRDPGSQVSFARKLEIIGSLQAVAASERRAMPKLRFVNYNAEPFLIAHFPGYSIEQHYPAMRTFQQAEIAVPDNIAIVVFATHGVRPYALLLDQLDVAGIPYHNPATPLDDWENVGKASLLAELLPTIRTEYTLVLDGLDVLLCGKIDPIVDRFRAYDWRVLFGATKHPHPRFYVAGTGEGREELGAFRYINAGTAFGHTEDLVAFYQRAAAVRAALDRTDDRYHSEQAIIRAVVAENPRSVGFDWRCSIFQLFNAKTKQDRNVVKIF